ncbi:MAG: glycosyltransferase family 39 protein [Bacteroidota bacterium]
MKAINEKQLWLGTSLLLLLGLFLNLGLQPLYLEEPRRAFITLEMLENQNCIVPTLWGLPYYNKPPFFNWVLIASAKLFGQFSEWTLRLPSVLSTLAVAGLMYRFVKAEFGQRLGVYSALLWVCSLGILFNFSMLAEIDLFFSLLVFGAIMAIYHFHKKGQLWLLFPVVYILLGMAFLSKGVPAVVFAGLSLLAFFIWKKQFWKLFHPAHFLGLFLLFGIVGGYYYAYSLYADPTPFLLNIWSESSDRAAWSQNVWTFVLHVVSFPFQVLKELAPALLLLPFLLRKEVWQKIWANDFLFFCFLMFAVNLLPYWLSPGTRMRYLYMLLPFGIILLLVLWDQLAPIAKKWQIKTSHGLMGTLVYLLPVGMLALPFLPDLSVLNYRVPLAIVACFILSTAAYLFYKRPTLRLAILLFSLAIGRLVFDLTVLPQRAIDSGAQRNKALAEAIYQEVGDAPITIVNDEKILSYTSTYYFNQLRGQVIRARYNPPFESGHYYLLCADQVPEGAEVKLRYPYDGSEQALILVK